MRWGEEINGEKVYNIHAGQKQFLQSQARITAAIAGTGGGKTAILPLALGMEIAKYPNEKWMVLAPTYKILQRATIPTFIDTYKNTTLEGDYTREIYKLPDDGTIYFVSTDNPGSIEGGQIKGAAIDEAGQMSYEAWIAIQGRTGQKQGRLFIGTTPYMENWLKTEVWDRYLQGDKDYFCCNFPSIANPVYSKDEYERMKRTLPDWLFNLRYNGIFTKPEGLVYPSFENCVVKHFDPPAGEHYGGVDFGFADPFAALCAVNYIDETTKKDMLYVYGERYKTQTLISEHMSFLPKEDILYYADPSEPAFIREMRVGGFNIRPARNDIIPGIEAVTRRINERTLLISDNCRALITEAKQYFYAQKDEFKDKDKKFKGLDHILDALRYLVFNIDRRKTW